MECSTTDWLERYHAALILTVRVRLLDRAGTLAELLRRVGDSCTPIGDVRIVGTERDTKVRDVQLFCTDEHHRDAVLEAIDSTEDVEIVSVTDEVLESHRGGPIATVARERLDSTMKLRMVYTPGVARVCELVAERPEAAWSYTGKGERVAIVTNGTAVLGLGDIGPLAALPVMEGKAAILAEFAGVSAEPMLVDSRDPDEVVDVVAKCALSYGLIQLEDIAAPACFEIERKLADRLDVPVFHDDQHGTATVVAAGFLNALERTGRTAEEVRAVVLGAGAAGSAIARMLVDLGVDDVVVCDSTGIVARGRGGMNVWKEELAEVTNQDGLEGGLDVAIRGRDVFVGVSRPNALSPKLVRTMADRPIVFALANPVSEIGVHEAMEAGAEIAIDGRSMNNALAFPGLFRGALDARARCISTEMKLAAARTLAAAATGDSLLPDMLDHGVHRAVAV
ncbi:MAG: NAD-dependent malic enzyme, partial [Planctomycetota bacterium JB042]